MAEFFRPQKGLYGSGDNRTCCNLKIPIIDFRLLGNPDYGYIIFPIFCLFSCVINLQILSTGREALMSTTGLHRFAPPILIQIAAGLHSFCWTFALLWWSYYTM